MAENRLDRELEVREKKKYVEKRGRAPRRYRLLLLKLATNFIGYV